MRKNTWVTANPKIFTISFNYPNNIPFFRKILLQLTTILCKYSLYPILPRTFSQQFTLQTFNPSLLTSRTKTRQTQHLERSQRCRACSWSDHPIDFLWAPHSSSWGAFLDENLALDIRWLWEILLDKRTWSHERSHEREVFASKNQLPETGCTKNETSMFLGDTYDC